MSIDFYTPPEIEEIISRCKTYIKSELLTANPTDQNSVIYSLIVALANLSNDNNKQILLDILPNVFPQYCKSESALSNFATLKNVPKTLATVSSGKVTIQGDEDTVIPLGTEFVANSIEYKTQASVQISNETITLSSLSVNGTLVTATTASSHNFASNLTITIAGATHSALNGSFVITSTGLNTFTYSIESTLTATETSGLTASGNIAVLSIKSQTTGSDTNLENGDAVAIVNAISGLNANAYVQFSGVSGGTVDESFEEWQKNVVDRYQNPITYFNENNIKTTAKSVSGVTKVWVYPITPSVGQVTVYFIRGNDDDIIPDVNEVEKVATKIKALRTVKDDPDDVFVYAPTPVTVNFTFSSISPNTPTMKDAIRNAIKQLFEDNVDLGVNLTSRDYNNAIGNSFDLETGTKLQSYTLTNPTGDITIASGRLPVLGTITFQ